MQVSAKRMHKSCRAWDARHLAVANGVGMPRGVGMACGVGVPRIVPGDCIIVSTYIDNKY